MKDSFVISPSYIRPPSAVPAGKGVEKKTSASFEHLLNERMQAGKLKFSKHAVSRMASRGVTMGVEKMGKLEEVVELMESKGARDSLVFMDNTAFVVSVKNRTVVTVVDQDSMKGNVFTNIDSAVIV
jgi:flagellar operon protein